MVFTQTHFQYLQRNTNYLLGYLLESVKYQMCQSLDEVCVCTENKRSIWQLTVPHNKFVKLMTSCFQCVCMHMLVHKWKHSINTYLLLATNFEVSATDFNPRCLEYRYTNHESDTGNQLGHFLKTCECECDQSIGFNRQCLIFCIRIKRVVSSALEVLPNLESVLKWWTLTFKKKNIISIAHY